jgi:hypothetical protein
LSKYAGEDGDSNDHDFNDSDEDGGYNSKGEGSSSKRDKSAALGKLGEKIHGTETERARGGDGGYVDGGAVADGGGRRKVGDGGSDEVVLGVGYAQSSQSGKSTRRSIGGTGGAAAAQSGGRGDGGGKGSAFPSSSPTFSTATAAASHGVGGRPPSLMSSGGARRHSTDLQWAAKYSCASSGKGTPGDKEEGGGREEHAGHHPTRLAGRSTRESSLNSSDSIGKKQEYTEYLCRLFTAVVSID